MHVGGGERSEEGVDGAHSFGGGSVLGVLDGVKLGRG